MWGRENFLIAVILNLAVMCRDYFPVRVEEEANKYQHIEHNYYGHWETGPELANTRRHVSLESDKRGLILDNYSDRTVAITRDYYPSVKLPVVTRTQSQPNTYDQNNTDEGKSDGEWDQAPAIYDSDERDPLTGVLSDVSYVKADVLYRHYTRAEDVRINQFSHFRKLNATEGKRCAITF